MIKRIVTLLLVFTVIFTMVTPFSANATAALSDSIRLLPALSNEKGIQLQWETTTSSEVEESFTLIKNNAQSTIASAQLISEKTGEEGTIHKVYQFIDDQVIPGETYQYSVTRNGEEELKSEAISVTYTQAEKLEINATNVSETGFELNWTEIQLADAYQVLLDGKVIKQVGQTTQYQMNNLEDGTSYTISVRAIQGEEVIAEATKQVETLAATTKAVEKSTEQAQQSEEPAVTSTEATEEAVTIPDKNLKREIKSALKLNRDEIYPSDLEKLTSLDVSYLDIHDLTGLEKATNLTELNLTGNSLSNYSSIQKLTSLKSLNLSETDFADLTALSSLKNLEVLDINLTNVTDISAITNHPALKELNLSYLELHTLSPIQQLNQLTTLIVYGETYAHLNDQINELKKTGLTIYSDLGSSVYLYEIKATENRATLEWEYEGDEDVAYYEVKVAEQTTKVAAEENTLVIDSLTSNTEYRVGLFAYNSKGEVIASTLETFKTLPAPSGEAVQFKDERLEKAIKAELGIDRAIYESDMKSLTDLLLDYKKISDLSGLEKAVNLEYLSVDGNPIKNFEPISHLTNLISLSLGNTGISDYSILENLTNLEFLSLHENNLESIDALPALEGLTYLNLYINNLKNLKGIEKFPALVSLDVDDNPLTSIAGLNKLTELESVLLSNTSLDNIDELLKLANLSEVYLYGNDSLNLEDESSPARQVVEQLRDKNVQVEFDSSEEEPGEEWLDVYIPTVTENRMDLFWDYYGESEITKYEVYVNEKLHSTVSGDEMYLEMDKLTPNTAYTIVVKAYDANGELVISSEPITETTWSEPSGETVVFKDENLKELVKEQLGIERDPRVSDMERLTSFYIYGSDIEDLTGLEYATNLYDLNVFDHQDGPLDLSAIQGLKQLRSILISDAQIKDYSVFAKLPDLEALNITNSNVSDLSFLSGMKNLTELSLENNQIKDITALAALTNLTFVNLADNNISDLSPLEGSKHQLVYLDVSGNPIENISILAQFDQIIELILDRTKITDISPLVEMDSLGMVSLYNISSLDLTEGSANAQVIKKLKEYHVHVNTEVDSKADIIIDDVTETTVSFSWGQMLPNGVGKYKVSLYSYESDEPIIEEEIDSSIRSHTFKGLDPFTDYYITVDVTEEGYENTLYAEFTTLPIEGTVKDVSMYVYKTAEAPEAGAAFDLYGLDKENEDVYYFGESDEQGQLINYATEESIDIFTLPIGNYEIVFTTVDGKEYVFQFEITSTDDYLENPLFFLLEDEGDKEPVTPPTNGENPTDPIQGGGDKEPTQGGNDNAPTPNNDSEKPTAPIKVVDKNGKDDNVLTPIKAGSSEKTKNELPETATMMYNLLLIGFIALCLGAAVLFIQKRKQVKNS
ncbi:leucine-rich repeat domain-containing protein [Metabacillus niabensis]|uniref:LPXTG-motif cell wall-anchored protein n=1 Tax=Metabacillus niabensis TaxID=324854 RepID=A0ABT9Z4H6_9BACI|nr:leucine-rich repeat domain-containing protein [Metabacillus niabensis]MDQ0227173.1 LPXTG-motif cell wall-anchored protein [Metabacillus niabensis]